MAKKTDEARQKELEKVTEIVTIHRYHLEQWNARLKAIRNNNAMVLGDQWDNKVREKLKKQNRPVITLNLELPLVMQLLGLQRTRPKSDKIIPVDNYGDDKIAEIMSKIMKHIANSNNQDYVEEQWFTAGVIGGVGWVELETDHEENPVFPQIKITPGDNTMILPDPDAKDPFQKDWKRVIKSAWMTWAAIHDRWSDSVDKKPPDSNSIADAWRLLSSKMPAPFRNTSQDDLVDRINDLYRVVELWERKKERIVKLVHNVSNEVHEVPEKSDIQSFIDADYSVVSVGVRYYLEQTVSLPYIHEILATKRHDYYYYPFFGFFPMKFAGLPIVNSIGYVENLHGVQEEKNRARSAMNDAVQKMPAGGMILPPGEDELMKDLKDRGSEPGFYGMRAGSSGAIEHLQQTFPSGWNGLMNSNDVDFQRISAQPLAMRGESESSEESGTLFRAKVAQGVTSMAPIFSAFGMARRLLGTAVIERIQKDYTEERIFRIIGEDPTQSEIVAINTKDATGRMLNDVSVGKYDIVLEEELHVKSQREESMAAWSEIVKALPPEQMAILTPELVRSSSLPNAREVADKLEQLTQQQFANNQNENQGGGQPPVQSIPSPGFSQ
tara:strand:+ start:2702 stop:4531 length:1830 start_codon:yes stop_codon:yes gene_type:complete